MVGLAGALVLNIGTLSQHWIDAMLLAGAAANERGIPIVLDPVGAGATQLPDDDREAHPRRGRRDRAARERGRGRHARRRRGGGARGRVDRRRRRRGRARPRGRTDARARRVGDRRGRPRLRRRAVGGGLERARAARGDHRHRLHVDGADRLLPRRRRTIRFEAAVEALVAFGVAGEDAARDAKGPGSFHVALYDALAGARPGDPDSASAGRDVVRLHALVSDAETGRAAAAGRGDRPAAAAQGRSHAAGGRARP